MQYFFIKFKTAIDNGITGHVIALGGLRLGDDKWLLKSSLASEDLRAVVMQSAPDRLEITELADQRELDALKLKWLGSEAAIAPPLEDFAARVRWRLRE